MLHITPSATGGKRYNSAGTRQYVLRPIKRHGGLFVFAGLTRAAANLALVRLRLGEAEKQLG